MVKITREYLLRHREDLKFLSVRQRKESDDEFLSRITHLKLQGRFIDNIVSNLKLRWVFYSHKVPTPLREVCCTLDIRKSSIFTHLNLNTCFRTI